MCNLRAKPDGLETHKKFLYGEIGGWLGHPDEADITFICTAVGFECSDKQTVHLTAHQAVLAPLSPLLRNMFKEYNCGHRREMIYISVDMDSEVVKAVLCLIYKGTTYLPPNAVEELKRIVKMLDFQFNGGFERVQMTGASKIPLYPTQVTSKTSLKRPRYQESTMEAKKIKSDENPKVPTTSSAGLSVRANANDRMEIHVSMSLQLKDAPNGTTATCKMPNCGAEVTYEQLAEHFFAHETADSKNELIGPIAFPCVACGLNFKYRRELDSHTKSKHGGGVSNIREKLDLISDSDSSSEDEEEEVLSNVTSSPKPSIICRLCDKNVPSSLHLSPSKHDCMKVVPPVVIKRPSSRQSDWSVDNDTSNYCHICQYTFKTFKAKKVHMKTKHTESVQNMDNETTVAYSPLNQSKPSATNGLGQSFTTTSTSTWKKYGCQICTKRFNEFSKLRTHYTLYHFWDSLSEDFKQLGDKCNICRKKYPTEDHLIQHMGNFHCIIDNFLVEKGL